MRYGSAAFRRCFSPSTETFRGTFLKTLIYRKSENRRHPGAVSQAGAALQLAVNFIKRFLRAGANQDSPFCFLQTAAGAGEKILQKFAEIFAGSW